MEIERSAEVDGLAFALIKHGESLYRWHFPDGTPTGLSVYASVEEAGRAFMFNGPGLAKEFRKLQAETADEY